MDVQGGSEERWIQPWITLIMKPLLQDLISLWLDCGWLLRIFPETIVKIVVDEFKEYYYQSEKENELQCSHKDSQKYGLDVKILTLSPMLENKATQYNNNRFSKHSPHE